MPKAYVYPAEMRATRDLMRRRLRRFPSVQDFASCSRLVKCERGSAGKSLGTGGAKIGSAYLKWAFSEAAVLFVAKSSQGKTLLHRLERKYGKPKALSVLAHKLGRAVYFMLVRNLAFEPQRFMKSYRRRGVSPSPNSSHPGCSPTQMPHNAAPACPPEDAPASWAPTPGADHRLT